MRVFDMNTLDGVTIPILMLTPGKKVTNIDTKMYNPEHGLSGYAPEALTLMWLDATRSGIARYLQSDSLGPQIMKQVGREITLPGVDEKGDVNLSIAPTAYEEIKSLTKNHVLNNDIETHPIYGIMYNKGVLGRYEDKTTAMYADMSGGGDGTGSYRAPIPQINYVTMDVLLMDYEQNVLPFAININWNLIDHEAPEVGAITLSSYRNISTNMFLGSDFWQNQTGTIREYEDKEEELEGGGIVDITNRFSPRLKTSALGAYPLTKDQVTEFISGMWTTEFSEKILQTVNGKPMDSIVSLRWYYGLLHSIQRTDIAAYVSIGNAVYDGTWGSGGSLITKPVNSEFVTYSSGEIDIPRHFKNFLDYTPFTEMQLYVPYVGNVQIDASDFMNLFLRLDYNINIVTGATMVHIYAGVPTGSWRLIDSIACTMGLEIPMNMDAKESILSKMATTAAGAVVVGATAAVSPALTVGALGATAGSLANSISPTGMPSGDTQSSGGLDSESSSLGKLIPHLTIKRPIPVAPKDYNELVGTPDFRSGSVAEFEGYFKIGSMQSKAGSTSIPREALEEVNQILREGVYSD